MSHLRQKFQMPQVVRKQLAVNQATVRCGDFSYEEGEGLEEDEVELYSAFLPRLLADLPGGGIKHGAIVDVADQEQDFNVQLVVHHRVHT